MTTRKPRPEYLNRDQVAEMIAAAVAAERARSDQALVGILLAIGGAGEAMGEMADALADAGHTLDLHAGLIGPIAEAFAAGLDLADAAEAPAHVPN